MNEIFKLGTLAAMEKEARYSIGKRFVGQKMSTKALVGAVDTNVGRKALSQAPGPQALHVMKASDRLKRIRDIAAKKRAKAQSSGAKSLMDML